MGGVAASRGHVNIVTLIVVVVACAIGGDSVGYLVGREWGQRLLDIRLLRHRQHPSERIGRRARIRPRGPGTVGARGPAGRPPSGVSGGWSHYGRATATRACERVGNRSQALIQVLPREPSKVPNPAVAQRRGLAA